MTLCQYASTSRSADSSWRTVWWLTNIANAQRFNAATRSWMQSSAHNESCKAGQWLLAPATSLLGATAVASMLPSMASMP